MRQKKTTLILSIVAFLLSPLLWASPGDLDPSFGNNGELLFDFGGTDNQGTLVAVQGDGKIIAAGLTSTGPSFSFGVARFEADGSFDDSFGTSGETTFNFGGTFLDLQGIALQSDGKALLVGSNYNGSAYEVAVARVGTSGSLDPSFGNGGKVTFNYGNSRSLGQAIALQEDGKIIIAGASGDGTNFELSVTRLNADGSPDISFGSAGSVFLDFGGTNDQAFTASVQADGKILVAGISGTSSYTQNAIARLDANGVLDPSFNGDGMFVYSFGGDYNDLKKLAILSDGKILALGDSNASGIYQFTLTRFDSSGDLDLSFDGDGSVLFDFGGDYCIANSLIAQAGGKILVGGMNMIPSFETFAVVGRLNSDGSFDPTFGTNGQVSLSLLGPSDFGSSLAMQSDGKVISGINAGGNPAYQNGMARLMGNSSSLAVTGSSSADSAKVGDEITYTVTITNNGPDTAEEVIVTDPLPSEVALSSAGASQGSCSGTTTVTCNLGSLDNGASATATITVNALSSGTLTNIIEVTLLGSDDPDADDNRISMEITVQGQGGDNGGGGGGGNEDGGGSGGGGGGGAAPLLDVRGAGCSFHPNAYQPSSMPVLLALFSLLGLAYWRKSSPSISQITCSQK